MSKRTLGYSLLWFALMVLVVSASINFGEAAEEQRRTVYSMDYFLGLKISVVAPPTAYPNENITITMNIEVSGATSLEFLKMAIVGLKNETEEVLFADISISSAPHEQDYVIPIPDDISPGLICGFVEWRWTHEGATISPPPVGFPITYVKNPSFEKLQLALNELNATYNMLRTNLTNTANSENELGAARNLVYVFIATTAVSAVTILVLLIRRPKRPWLY